MSTSRLLLLVPLLLGTACGDMANRGPMGWIIDTDGSTRSSSNPDNHRIVHGHRIDQRLAAANPGWTFTTAIAEKPVYDWDPDDAVWEYPTATVTVLASEPASGGTLDQAKAEQTVRHFFRELAKPEAVSVSFTIGQAAMAVTPKPVDPKPAAAKTKPTSAPNPPSEVAATPTKQPTYVVQQGDTLAGISAVFYGTNKHWKAILKANEGLSPTKLRVGQVIVIPTLK